MKMIVLFIAAVHGRYHDKADHIEERLNVLEARIQQLSPKHVQEKDVQKLDWKKDAICDGVPYFCKLVAGASEYGMKDEVSSEVTKYVENLCGYISSSESGFAHSVVDLCKENSCVAPRTLTQTPAPSPC